MARHLKLTIKLTALRQDPEHLKKVQSYAMTRYIEAWGSRHYSFAETCFTATERCARLSRLLAAA